MKSEMRIDKTNSKKFHIIIVMLFLGMLINFVAAILHGIQKEWINFWVCLTGSVIINQFFVGVLILWKLNLLSDKLTKNAEAID